MAHVFFCDRCGKTIETKELVQVFIKPIIECEYRKDLCKECSKSFLKWLDEIKGETNNAVLP